MATDRPTDPAGTLPAEIEQLIKTSAEVSADTMSEAGRAKVLRRVAEVAYAAGQAQRQAPEGRRPCAPGWHRGYFINGVSPRWRCHACGEEWTFPAASFPRPSGEEG